jgi:transcriptional regulator with XRE-family HTH domain
VWLVLENFGDFIKNKRKQLNIGSRELSRLVNKGSSYISQVENGRNKKPSYFISYSILQALEMSEEEINSVLKRFEIEPTEKEIIFNTAIDELRQHLSEPPANVLFIKDFDQDTKQDLMLKIDNLNMLLTTSLDFNPDDTKLLVNELYNTVIAHTDMSVVKRVKEIINDPTTELNTTLSMSTQLQEELKNRGISDLLSDKSQ